MKTLAGIISLAVLSLVLFVAWASSESMPSDVVLESEVYTLGDDVQERAADVPPGTLTVIAWNIGYGRGFAGDFAGPWDSSVFDNNLEGMAEVIRQNRVDVALLQEVDLGASRSHGVHQGKELAKRLGWPYVACATTWSNRYVPFPYWPISKQYGAMHSGQCVISRFPLKNNVRYRMPQPSGNPFWYNWFYLHRATQFVEVSVPSVGEVTLVNVHLEAFDPENNLEQVLMLRDRMNSRDGANMIVGGDFNALPPDAVKRTGFSDEPDIDFTNDRSVQTFFEDGKLQDVVSMVDAPEFHTFPADAPTRRLDYVGVSPAMWESSGSVLKGACQTLSDHLPVLAKLRLRKPPEDE